jgi:hypothetical protein
MNKDERGGEKRWYQKPEFIWMVGTFVLLQLLTYIGNVRAQATNAARQEANVANFTQTMQQFLRDDAHDKGEQKAKMESLNKAIDDANHATERAITEVQNKAGMIEARVISLEKSQARVEAKIEERQHQ